MSYPPEETFDGSAETTLLVPDNPTPPATPTVCWNCGQPLAPGQMFCSNCGSKADAPLERNDNIARFNELTVKKKKSKKKALIITLSILLVVLLVGGGVSYVFYFEPNSRYTEAMDLYDEGQYEAASKMFADLEGFKDSADMVTKCETAIKQAKYDEAMTLASNRRYGTAIAMLQELGDFSDSQAKITQLEEEYYGLLQQIYGYVHRGFDTDTSLSTCVYNTLWMSDLYDATDSVAMSKLYGGTSYYVYYYWSYYYNGYAYVVESDTAEAFVYLLNLTNTNATEINQLLTYVEDAPAKYQSIYQKVKSMCDSYIKFHNYVKTKPSVGYTSYEKTSDSYESAVKSAMTAVTNADSKMDDKVSTYKWS